MQPPFLTSERQPWSRASRVVESGDLSSNSQNASSYLSRQQSAGSGYHRSQHTPTPKAATTTTAHDFRCPSTTARHAQKAFYASRRPDEAASRGESDLLTSEFSTDCISPKQHPSQRHYPHQPQKGHHHHHHGSHLQQQQQQQQQKRPTTRRRRHPARSGGASSNTNTLRSQARRGDRQRADPMGVTSAHVASQRNRHNMPRRGSQTRFASPDAQMTFGSTGNMMAAVSSSNRETSSEARRSAARHQSTLERTADSMNFPPAQNKLSSFTSKSIGIDSYDTSTLFGYFDRPEEPNIPGFQRTDMYSQLDPTANKRRDSFSSLTHFQSRCIHAMADIIMCPYTVLPVSIGVFTRPGVTSREAYIQKLFTYLKELQRRDEPSLEERAGAFDLTSAFLPPIIALLLSYILSLLFGWQLGLTVGLTSIFLYILFLAIVIFGRFAKNWKKAIEIGETAARYSRSWRLILDILFNQPPRVTNTPQHVRLIPITLNLGASYTAWDATVQLSEKMWGAAATRYSMLAMLLQWAGKDIPTSHSQRCRKSCCLPLWFWSLLCLLSSLTFATVLRIHGVSILSARAAAGAVNGTADKSFEPRLKRPTGDRVSAIMAIVSLTLWLLSLLILCIAIARPVCRLLRGRVRLHTMSRDFYADDPTESEFPILCAGGGGGRDRCETDGCIGTATAPGCFPPPPLPPSNKWPYMGGANGPQNYTRTDITTAATVAATAAAVAAVTARDKHCHSSSRHGRHLSYGSPGLRNSQRLRRKLADHQRRRRKHDDAIFLETEDAILLEESRARCPKRMKAGRVPARTNARNGAVLRRHMRRTDNGGVGIVRDSSMPYSMLSDEDDDGILGTDSVGGRLSMASSSSSSTDACSLGSSDAPYRGRSRPDGKNITSLELGLTGAGGASTGATVGENEKANQLTAVECQLRRQLLETCLILSMLDSRHGSRQTRFLISVDAFNDSIGLNRGSIKKIAAFCRLLEKLLFNAPGGINGAVQWFVRPDARKAGGVEDGQDMEEQEDKADSKDREVADEERETDPNLTAGEEPVTNVILMIMCTEGGSLQTLREFEKQFDFPRSLDNATGPQSAAPTLAATSVRIKDLPVERLGIKDFWQVIHDSCHLTVYLDEPTPGQLLLSSITDGELDRNSVMRTSHSGSGHIQTSELPGDKMHTDRAMGRSLLEHFLCDHPLADINCSKLRHLLTHIAFLGRLLKSEGEQTGSLMKPPRSATRCNMLRPTVLDVVGAWLCLLLHWPFHTAWLTLFLEEHFSPLDERVLSTDQSPARESHATSTNADQVTLTEGAEEGSGVDAGPPPVKVNPVYPTDTLSALYLRVLERLAPALTASQRKARSASMSDLGHYSTDMASSAGITLRLCELASRDQSALRLADYLQAGSSSSANKPDGPKRRRRMTCQLQASAVVGGGVRAFAAGDLTVGDLIRVMSCSPFLNAQTRRWIRAFLSRKGFSFMRSQSKELRGKGTLIKGQMDNAEGPSAMLTTTATRPCHVRLKNGLPEKALSAMTVEDICRLIADIVDLSFNQSLRTATNEAGQQGSQRRKRDLVATSPLTISPDYSEQGHQSFTEHDLQAPEGVSEVERASSLLALCQKQVRKLNISGAVLAVCNLSELRNELGLSFGDWQLFNAVIIHLRQLEELGQVRDEGGNQKSEELVAFKRPDQPATVEGAGRRITDTGEGKASLGHQRQPRQQCEDLKKAANHELQQTESDSSGELKYSYGSKIQPPTGNSISAASEKKFTRPVGSLRSFAATLDRQPYHGTTAARHLPACPHFQEGLYRRNVQLPLTVHSHFASQQTGLSSPHAVQRYACARSTGDLAGLGGLNKHTPLADLQRHACASNASAGQQLHHQARPGHAKMVAAAAAVAEASSITETLGRWRSGLATSGAGGGGGGETLPLAEVTTAPIRSAPADTRPPQPTGEVLYHPTLAGTPLGSCGQVARKGDAATAKYLRTKSGSFEFGVAPNGEPNPEKETATESSTTRTLKSILGSPKRPVPAAAQPDPGQQLPPTAHWYALEVRRARSEPTSQLPSQSHSRDDSHPSSPDAVYTSGASEFSYSQAELEPSDIHSACSPYSSSNSSLSSAGSSSATTSLSKTSADSSARIKDYENNQYCKRPRHEVMSLANQR